MKLLRIQLYPASRYLPPPQPVASSVFRPSPQIGFHNLYNGYPIGIRPHKYLNISLDHILPDSQQCVIW